MSDSVVVQELSLRSLPPRRPKGIPYEGHAPKVRGLSAQQQIMAREIAKGKDVGDLRKKYHVGLNRWKRWLADPRFQAEVERRMDRADERVEEVLRDGEALAAQTLLEALGATVPIKLKDGRIRFYPQWDVRLRAAVSFLDRRGERGRPVERSQSATLNLNSANVAKQLVAALAEPAVREFIEQDPDFANRFRKELAQLPTPCDSPPSPDSS